MRIKKLSIAATGAALATAAAFGLSGCSGGSASASSDGPIVLGATLPMTGTWAQTGADEKNTLDLAIADINAKGGIKIGSTKHKVKLVTLDNRSDIPTITDQTRTLILQDKVQALFGQAVTEDAVAEANVAERYRIPLLSSVEPTIAFAAGSKSGWQYSYDLYYSEKIQAANLVDALDLKSTNKKAAVFSDNSQDGVTQSADFSDALKAKGYSVVEKKSFPMGTTDFSSGIQSAEGADADVLVAIFTPPDAFALMKQIKALGYAPKITDFPKTGDGSVWPEGLKSLGDGTLGQSGLLPASAQPIEQKLVAKGVVQPDAGVETSWYAVAQIYQQAVEKAGSSDPKKVNTALESLSADTIVGKVKFNDKHVFNLPMYVYQWQNQKAVQVYPEVAGHTFQFPNPTLAH